MFWIGQRSGLNHLGQISKTNPNAAFGTITRNTPLPREGGEGSKENSSNVLQRSTTSLYNDSAFTHLYK